MGYTAEDFDHDLAEGGLVKVVRNALMFGFARLEAVERNSGRIDAIEQTLRELPSPKPPSPPEPDPRVAEMERQNKILGERLLRLETGYVELLQKVNELTVPQIATTGVTKEKK